MKIVISGSPASGKSSVGKALAERLGLRHYSMGDLQRQIAIERNIDIVELGKIESRDDSIDRMIDDRQMKIGAEEDDFVIDSWLGAKFIPEALKIFIDADMDTRAERRLGHRRDEEAYDDIRTVKEKMQKREAINRERWMRYYDFDYTDMDNYDLVIDSSAISIDEVVDRIEDFIKTEALKTRAHSDEQAAS